MSDPEKIREALQIFKLEELPRSRFSELSGLLKKRYHLLAQKVHPDHSGYQSDLFIRLRNHFELLQRILETAPGQIKQLLADVPAGLPRDTSGGEFRHYKEIISAMNIAVNRYFEGAGKGADQEILNRYRELSGALEPLRKELADLLANNPRAVWTEDAQKNLRKIDIWLRESQSSVS